MASSSKVPFAIAMISAGIVLAVIFLVDQRKGITYELAIVPGEESAAPRMPVVFEGNRVGTVSALNPSKGTLLIEIPSNQRTAVPLVELLTYDVEINQLVLELKANPHEGAAITTQEILDSAEGVILATMQKWKEAEAWYKTGTGAELRQKTQQYLRELEAMAESKSATVREEVFVQLNEGEKLVQEVRTRYDAEYADEVKQTLATIREKAKTAAQQAEDAANQTQQSLNSFGQRLDQIPANPQP
jgi:hypothetical protein